MRQPVVWITVLIVVGLMIILTMGVLRMPKAALKTFPADNGSNFIDVSNYPSEMQERYKLFARKCSRCHTLARPVNSVFLGEAWRKYVYKMMKKPGAGLTPKVADEIIEFLIYDSQARKKGNNQ